MRSTLRSPVLLLAAVLLALALGSTRSASAGDAPPSATTPPATGALPSGFDTAVMTVLSKAGCNQGACHGNQNGKGGFKLSLRGQGAEGDFRALVREQSGRRLNLLEPDQSLVLLKATNRLPHLGGRRFGPDAAEYTALRTWIAAGAAGPIADGPHVVRLDVQPADSVIVEPAATVQLTAVATWSDGTQRDVTRWTTFETTNLVAEVAADGRVERRQFGETTVVARYLQSQQPVSLAFIPARPTATASPTAPHSSFAAESLLDQLAQAKWLRLRLEPSEPAADATLVRRLWLDLIGRLPPPDEAREFVADTAPDKRVRLVDQLLARPEFAELWAQRWCDLLRVEEKVLDNRGVERFHAWIRDSLSLGKPLDEFVRDLLVARGSTYTNPPANYWRALRDPPGRGETTARLFLGVRLQCAQCHNHPYDRWTQDDYFSWTSLFTRLDYKILANDRKDKLDLNEFNGEQLVEWTESGAIKNPRTGNPAEPRLLGVAGPTGDDVAPLDALADWLTDRNNPLFVRAQANFVWYHVMGRGLVEPIDDMRATNPPSNPALLDALARRLADSGFDLRDLVRSITTSQVYALSGQPNATNQDDEANFARAIVRRLPAELLLDAQADVLDVAPRFGGYPAGTRAVQLAGVQRGRERDQQPAAGDRFLRMFGKPARLLGCECERSSETTLGQALSLLSDADLQERLIQPGNRLDQLLHASGSTSDLVDALYWTALTRSPSADERAVAVGALDAAADRSAVLQDLTWALLNAKEFLFRH